MSTAGNNGEGSFLLDLRAKRAQIPLDASGRPAKLCMTSIHDAARFIIAAIMQKPLHLWPRELRMRGERLDVMTIVRLAENLRGKLLLSHELETSLDSTAEANVAAGSTFERLEYPRSALQSELQLAQTEGNVPETIKNHRLMAVGTGAYDFVDANLNSIVNVVPYRFENWLREVWNGAF